MSSDDPLALPERGFLVVISGPSGVGKTSFCTHLLATREDVVRSVSVTTREIRPGEEDGRDYLFVSSEEFDRRVRGNDFLEHAEVHGSRYGTPRSFIEQSIASGQVVLLNIDVQGGLSVKRVHPDGVFVFVYPPSIESLGDRLRKRRQNDEADIARRLANAPGEMRHWREYDYVVVNDDLPRALSRMSSIVEAERARVGRLGRKEKP